MARSESHLKNSRREIPIAVVRGRLDPDFDPDANDHPLECAPLECYAQVEHLSYAGTVDWEEVFHRAGVPNEYRHSWRALVQDGATARDIPEAHYRWILRACRSDPWQSQIRSAIEAARQADPLFAVPRPNWNNATELHRQKNHRGWHPVAQSSVSTICTSAATSKTKYLKDGDRPGPLTWRPMKRVQRIITGCKGFRENFRGERLEEYRRSQIAGLQALIVGTQNAGNCPRNGVSELVSRDVLIRDAHASHDGHTTKGSRSMLLTLSEVARRLGVGEKAAREIAKSLPRVRVGKRDRFPESAVIAFANPQTKDKPGPGRDLSACA